MPSEDYLKPFLDGTPLSIERIKAAWPEFRLQEKIKILSTLQSGDLKLLVYQRNALADLALCDTSAYVRYLGAKDVGKPFANDDIEENNRFKTIEADASELVRFANAEGDDLPLFNKTLKNPELFWSLNHVHRLLQISGIGEGGEELAEIIKYATKELLPKNIITLEEICDVVLQYLGGQTLSERVRKAEDNASFFRDGSFEYESSKSIEALWNVIPDIPKPISYLLLDSLPESGGMGGSIPEPVLDSLDDDQLTRLLYRHDVSLKDLRRKLFEESEDNSLRRAAMTSYQFELMDSDISSLVIEKDDSEEEAKNKLKGLVELATNCSGVTLAQMEAICNLIRDTPKELHSGFGNWDALGFGEQTQELRAKRYLSNFSLEQEVFQLRLYLYAKELIEHEVNYFKNPAKFSDSIIKGNVWETYVNLKGKIFRSDWKDDLTFLPIAELRYFDIPKNISGENDRDMDDSFEELPAPEDNEMIDLLKEVQNNFDTISDQDKAELQALTNAFTKLSDNQNFLSEQSKAQYTETTTAILQLNQTITFLKWLIIALVGVFIYTFYMK